MFLLMLVNLIFISSTLAQVDFLKFIQSVDWSSSEKDFVLKNSTIVVAGEHRYSDYDKSVCNYVVNGVRFGNSLCVANIYVDSVTKVLKSISFSFDIDKKKDPIILSQEMDNVLINMLGAPNSIKNDESSKSLKHYDRSWYGDKYNISVNHFVFTRSQIYSLTVKGLSYKRVPLSQFLDSVIWDCTESEIVNKYPASIKEKSHYYSKYDKTVSNYSIEGITLGGLFGYASVYVDSATKKLSSFSFFFENLDTKKDSKVLTKEMDDILTPIFGVPDKKTDEEDSKYVNDHDRTWIKDKYALNVKQMVFSSSQIYSLTAKGISSPGGNDFRVAKWGDSKESIIQKEGKPNDAIDDRLYMFSDFVAGMSCDVVYIFTNNILTMSKYIFKDTHTNKNEYITDFRKMVSLMTEKYGEPDYNKPTWSNSLYKDEPDEYGFAVSLGHLIYSAGWLGNKTNILVLLSGENYKQSLIIQYKSLKFQDLKSNEDKQKIIKDL